MDFEALQKFAVANFSQYFSTTVDMLTRPGLHFAPVVVQTGGTQTAQLPKGRAGSQLNPQLVGFAVLSMFLGLTLNSLITKRPATAEMLTVEVVGLLFWALYASLVHLLCKLARGRGSFLETVSVTIQIFATLYVVCSAITTAVAMIVLVKPIQSFIASLGSIGEMVAENPVVLFFVIHTILFMIYLPLGLKTIHKFNLLQLIAVGVLSGLLVLLQGVAMIAFTGAIWSVEPSPAAAGLRIQGAQAAVGEPSRLVASAVQPIAPCFDWPVVPDETSQRSEQTNL